MVGTEQPGTGSSISGRILLDSPTASPALGYVQTGRALATIIKQSEPRFAVGIFGGWGSGKTTLMQAIRDALAAEQGLVVADFNAWRFEREPQLLIPLLDTIRAALVRGADAAGDSKDGKKIRSIAIRVGSVVRALATGLTAQLGLPGAVTVSYDVGAALAALSSPADPQNSQSLYVAAFDELDRAFRELHAAGISRIVVFVDDLDRCLPLNALQVLEAMKLFFDLRGFIFVVGLDEDIVDRAIRAKFAAENDPATAQTTGPKPADTPQLPQRIGREYVKKIFQIPYSIPPMLPRQLDDLLASMYQEASLEQAQLDDLTKRVRPYLDYVAVGGRVNPREVKRFINAYTLQTLIRPDLDRDTVLALQTLAFRHDWAEFYEAVLADSALFVDALRRYRRGQGSDHLSFEDMAPGLSDLPPSLASYLRSERAEALTRHPALDMYLTSLQSYHSVNQWELDAFRQLGSLRREIGLALDGGDAVRSARSVATTATTVMDRLSGSLVGGSLAQLHGLKSAIEQVRSAATRVTDRVKSSQENTLHETEVRAALNELNAAVEKAREELRLVRDSSILRP
jgi:KAP family P-loop domain